MCGFRFFFEKPNYVYINKFDIHIYYDIISSLLIYELILRKKPCLTQFVRKYISNIINIS